MLRINWYQSCSILRRKSEQAIHGCNFVFSDRQIEARRSIQLTTSLPDSVSLVNEDHSYLAATRAKGHSFSHEFRHTRLCERATRTGSNATTTATRTIAFGHTHPIAEVRGENV